jgi:DHA1 family tetracycline resistance protein-like MFS transporter
LRETVEKKKDFSINGELFHFNHFKIYFSNKKISPKLWQFFFFLISHMIFTTQFALYADLQLGITAKDIGFVFTYVGLNSIILRGVLLSKIIDFFGEKKLMYLGMMSMIFGLIGAAFIRNWVGLLFVITFFAFGSGVNRPLMIGSISRLVSEKNQGEILGLTGSLASLSQIISPLMGGFMINYFWTGSLPLVSAVAMTIGLMFMIRNSKKY